MTINQTTTELLTIRDWLRYAVSRFENSDIFFGHGTDNAYDEAVWLIMSGLHLPHDKLNECVGVADIEPLKDTYKLTLEKLLK